MIVHSFIHELPWMILDEGTMRFAIHIFTDHLDITTWKVLLSTTLWLPISEVACVHTIIGRQLTFAFTSAFSKVTSILDITHALNAKTLFYTVEHGSIVLTTRVSPKHTMTSHLSVSKLSPVFYTFIVIDEHAISMSLIVDELTLIDPMHFLTSVQFESHAMLPAIFELPFIVTCVSETVHYFGLAMNTVSFPLAFDSGAVWVNL